MLDDRWYARYSDGSSKKVQEVTPAFRTYTHYRDEKSYVNINGRNSKGYDNIRDVLSTQSGKYAYWYRENGKYHVMINIDGTEKSSRGYDVDGWSLQLTESGKYAYRYKENEKWHVMTNIDGTEKSSRGYDDVGYESLHLTENGKYVYTYRENGKWHVMINIDGTEKSSRGYDDVHWNINLTESGKCAYLYEENEKWHVNMNGKDDARGFDRITGLAIDDKGYNFYCRRDDGKVYKNSNGEDTESEYLSGMDGGSFGIDFFRNYQTWHTERLEIYSPNKEHSFDSSYEHAHVVIDGETHGHAPALYAWYDAEKNAFIWNAIEGKELVVYEYKL
jgi:hypothetical protein